MEAKELLQYISQDDIRKLLSEGKDLEDLNAYAIKNAMQDGYTPTSAEQGMVAEYDKYYPQKQKKTLLYDSKEDGNNAFMDLLRARRAGDTQKAELIKKQNPIIGGIADGLLDMSINYGLAADGISRAFGGDGFIDDDTIKTAMRVQGDIDKSKELKNNLSDERKAEIEKLKKAAVEGDTIDSLRLLWDQVSNVDEWTLEGIVSNVVDPINIATMFATGGTSTAAKMSGMQMLKNLAMDGFKGGAFNVATGTPIDIAAQASRNSVLPQDQQQSLLKTAKTSAAANFLMGGIMGSAGGLAGNYFANKQSGGGARITGVGSLDDALDEALKTAYDENFAKINNGINPAEYTKTFMDENNIFYRFVRDNLSDKSKQLVLRHRDIVKSTIDDTAAGIGESYKYAEAYKDYLKNKQEIDFMPSESQRNFTNIFNNGNSVTDPRLEGFGGFALFDGEMELNKMGYVRNEADIFNTLKSKGLTDEYAKVLSESMAAKDPSILAKFYEWKIYNNLIKPKIANAAKLAIEDATKEVSSKYFKMGRYSRQLDDIDAELGYKIIEADELNPNLDGGTGYQTRLRTEDNVKQINSIINDFNPNYIFNQHGGAEGHPIVAKDGSVIVGNHRATALKSLTPEGRKRYNEAAEEEYGKGIFDGYKNPIIVRELIDTDDALLRKIAAVSNRGGLKNEPSKLLEASERFTDRIDDMRFLGKIQNKEALANMLDSNDPMDSARGMLNYLNPRIAKAAQVYYEKTKKDNFVVALVDNSYMLYNIRVASENKARWANVDADITPYLDKAIIHASTGDSKSRRDLFSILNKYNDEITGKSRALDDSMAKKGDDFVAEVLSTLIQNLNEHTNPSLTLEARLNNLYDAVENLKKEADIWTGEYDRLDIYDSVKLLLASKVDENGEIISSSLLQGDNENMMIKISDYFRQNDLNKPFNDAVSAYRKNANKIPQPVEQKLKEIANTNTKLYNGASEIKENFDGVVFSPNDRAKADALDNVLNALNSNGRMVYFGGNRQAMMDKIMSRVEQGELSIAGEVLLPNKLFDFKEPSVIIVDKRQNAGDFRSVDLRSVKTMNELFDNFRNLQDNFSKRYDDFDTIMDSGVKIVKDGDVEKAVGETGLPLEENQKLLDGVVDRDGTILDKERLDGFLC